MIGRAEEDIQKINDEINQQIEEQNKKDFEEKEKKNRNKFFENLFTFFLALCGIAITTGILVFTIKFFLMFATASAILIPATMAAIEAVELSFSIKAYWNATTDKEIAKAKRKLIFSTISFGFSLTIVGLAVLAVLSTLATFSALGALSVVSFGSVPTFILIGVVAAAIAFKLYEFGYEQYLKYLEYEKKCSKDLTKWEKIWGFIKHLICNNFLDFAKKIFRRCICLVDDIPLLFLETETAAAPATAAVSAAAPAAPVGMIALIAAGYFIFLVEAVYSVFGMYEAYFERSLFDDICSLIKKCYQFLTGSEPIESSGEQLSSQNNTPTLTNETSNSTSLHASSSLSQEEEITETMPKFNEPVSKILYDKNTNLFTPTSSETRSASSQPEPTNDYTYDEKNCCVLF